MVVGVMEVAIKDGNSSTETGEPNKNTDNRMPLSPWNKQMEQDRTLHVLTYYNELEGEAAC